MRNAFDPNLPIYLQVMDEIKKDILSKLYLPGQKIASVRELALKYGVNPNTIQKALTELEREGLLRSERAVGRYVTDNQDFIYELRHNLSKTTVTMYIQEMSSLGYNDQEMIDVLSIELKEKNTAEL